MVVQRARSRWSTTTYHYMLICALFILVIPIFISIVACVGVAFPAEHSCFHLNFHVHLVHQTNNENIPQNFQVSVILKEPLAQDARFLGMIFLGLHFL